MRPPGGAIGIMEVCPCPDNCSDHDCERHSNLVTAIQKDAANVREPEFSSISHLELPVGHCVYENSISTFSIHTLHPRMENPAEGAFCFVKYLGANCIGAHSAPETRPKSDGGQSSPPDFHVRGRGKGRGKRKREGPRSDSESRADGGNRKESARVGRVDKEQGGKRGRERGRGRGRGRGGGKSQGLSREEHERKKIVSGAVDVIDPEYFGFFLSFTELNRQTGSPVKETTDSSIKIKNKAANRSNILANPIPHQVVKLWPRIVRKTGRSASLTKIIKNLGATLQSQLRRQNGPSWSLLVAKSVSILPLAMTRNLTVVDVVVAAKSVAERSRNIKMMEFKLMKEKSLSFSTLVAPK